MAYVEVKASPSDKLTPDEVKFRDACRGPFIILWSPEGIKYLEQARTMKIEVPPGVILHGIRIEPHLAMEGES